jgi:hypothetical protein
MKFLLIIMLIFISYIRIFAQEKQDSLNLKPDKEFVDENRNGIDDREESGYGTCSEAKKCDKFTDKDGDGINDDRDWGIGKKHKHKRGKK